MEITKKDLTFIDEIDIRIILGERLAEIDRIVSVDGNLSTIFLSVSVIEGILKHLAKIFKQEIMRSENYPKENGNKKEFDRLTIEDLYILLKGYQILPDKPNFEHIYHIFRDYRNFIHPQQQMKKSWAVGLGQAQMALGLLNSTIEHLSKFLFIDKYIFEKISGRPDFNNDKNLVLSRGITPFHSFLLLRSKVESKLLLKFMVELHKGSILNFVFNFENESNFKMIRLDNRNASGYKNCLLYCHQKYEWAESAFANIEHPPSNQPFEVEINIDKNSNVFDFKVDENTYNFSLNGTLINLSNEFSQGLKIGLFNELLPVKLSKISLEL